MEKITQLEKNLHDRRSRQISSLEKGELCECLSRTPQIFQTPRFLSGIWLKFRIIEGLIWIESGVIFREKIFALSDLNVGLHLVEKIAFADSDDHVDNVVYRKTELSPGCQIFQLCKLHCLSFHKSCCKGESV